ncbi:MULTISPECIES: acyl carrier protein [Streptomyces]|jgi:acyl carrier protein|uniref:Acyl carrier protein n=1 Tax=Streptomyces doudnae TaxID=3075536 RepID=A0ABD5ERV4_9ACTN|nr:MULTISPECIES: acyl carrier protein [unclassified Streptomyces]MDT0436580.1 acyl carrier protein [Streptomyces sp. DSM 41981]MYQ63347.1 acyl carrier protein [Streptomyces sp. SID4950]SCD56386.1 acyl carrier protein [Streptomyces sp. SolWspMP-5a-2]
MPSREDLALLVRTTVSDVLGTDAEDVHERTSLVDDFGIDSLELMEIGARLERALKLRIAVEDLTSARDVGEAIDLLRARTAEPV